MRRTFVVTLGLIAMIVVSFAFTAEEPPRYKNLKVLPKNTTKEQMDSVMHHFTGSLGVKCNFCHVFNAEQKAMDFASDDKPEKHTAREMLRMTQKLNKKYFDINNSKQLGAKLEVTCFTCHNGKEHPGTMPPPMQRPGGQPNQGRASADSARH